MIFKNTLSLRVINLWNDLPSYVANSISVTSFKTNTDQFWRTQYKVSIPPMVE